MSMTGTETAPTAHEVNVHLAEPAAKPGSGYFVLVVLMVAAICLFLAFAIPTFSGIVGLMLQGDAGG